MQDISQITWTFSLSAAHCREALSYCRWVRGGRSFVLILVTTAGVGGLIGLSVGIYLAVTHQLKDDDVQGYVMALLLVWLPILVWGSAVRSSRPIAQPGPLTVTATLQGLAYQTADKSAFLPWAEFRGVEQSFTLLVLFLDRTFIAVPQATPDVDARTAYAFLLCCINDRSTRPIHGAFPVLTTPAAPTDEQAPTR